MKRLLTLPLLLLLAFVPFGASVLAKEWEPVTPDALPEVKALLKALYALEGHYTLVGQHNYPNTKDQNSVFSARYTGKLPAVWSSDMGHAKAGDSDSYLARPDIVKEAIRQHRAGALVTLCWHAIPPTSDEPGTFRPLPGADPKKLASVQGRLLDEQFRDLLTPGTSLYQHWCEQVDAVAVFLKQLEEARVPVLWRPYHEMNGDWFWWGQRTGEYSTAALYRQLFDRLVNHHHLKNLIWVWSVDRSSKPNMEHEKYFPGIQYLDILGLDVYRNDFGQGYYDSLVGLSQGKLLTLAEVGNPPSSEVLTRQPKWLFYVTWAGMVRNTSPKEYREFAADPRRLGLGDAAYAEWLKPVRAAAGLPGLAATTPALDVSGFWLLEREKSEFGPFGAGYTPDRLELSQSDGVLRSHQTFVQEFGDNKVVEEVLTLDGKDNAGEFMGAAKSTRGRVEGNQLAVEMTAPLPWGPPGGKMDVKETWTLENAGTELLIARTTVTPSGTQRVKLVYVRH